ncbi:VOC family protein [Actinoplanes sp. CA-015351]|uniref:VOC family protein n=1 Tax=Actinoplanes sp. CA-015351 TaxID=3239897 RepID=UPI003D9901F1
MIAIDALDPRRIAEFWMAVFGWTVVDEDDEVISIGPGDSAGPAGSGPAGFGPTIDVARVRERKQVKNRLHLDVRADGSSQQDEVARLLALGASLADVGQPDDVSWVVLADPEGNEFCVLSRSVQDVSGLPGPATA